MTINPNTSVQAQVQAAVNVLAQTMVTVMSVNIMASALGILIAATPMAAIPKETKATRKGLASLREAFGESVVNRAVEEAGTDDIVALAMKVEELVRADMVERYGEWATNAALASAPPGDLRAAKDIARVLHAQRATPATPIEKVEQLAETGKKKARAAARPVVDTKTNIQYKSESAGAKAVAAEYNLVPDDHWAWYRIIKIDPDRFKHV